MDENIVLNSKIIVLNFERDCFKFPFNCFKLTLPSYHCGEYVFMTASKSHDSAKVELETLVDRQSQREIVTKYWSPAMHFASQVFPPSSPLGEY